eukprot:5725725-Amphidinium_carterae.1
MPGQPCSSTAVPREALRDPDHGVAENVEVIAISDAEDFDTLPVDPDEELTQRPKRVKWDLAKLPAHIVLESDPFQQRYVCLNCACSTGVLSRNAFFRKHFACEGENLHTIRHRHFLRKARLALNRGLTPSAEELLQPDWYQHNGMLPYTISQSVSGGLLACRVCGSTSHPCNRRRFIVTHLKCLQKVVKWGAGGAFHFDDSLLDIALNNAGDDTFVNGKVKRRRGPKARTIVSRS